MDDVADVSTALDRVDRLCKRRKTIKNGCGEPCPVDNQLEEFGMLEEGMTPNEKADLLQALNNSRLTAPQQRIRRSSEKSSQKERSYKAPIASQPPEGDGSSQSSNFDDVTVVLESPVPDSEERPLDEDAEAATKYADIYKILERASTQKGLMIGKVREMDPWIPLSQRKDERPMKRKRLAHLAASVPRFYTPKGMRPQDYVATILRNLDACQENLVRAFHQSGFPFDRRPEWGRPVEVGRHMPNSLDIYRQPLRRRYRIEEEAETGDDDTSDSDVGHVAIAKEDRPFAGLFEPRNSTSTAATAKMASIFDFDSEDDVNVPAESKCQSSDNTVGAAKSEEAERRPAETGIAGGHSLSLTRKPLQVYGSRLRSTRTSVLDPPRRNLSGGKSDAGKSTSQQRLGINVDDRLSDLDDMFEHCKASVKINRNRVGLAVIRELTGKTANWEDESEDEENELKFLNVRMGAKPKILLPSQLGVQQTTKPDVKRDRISPSLEELTQTDEDSDVPPPSEAGPSKRRRMDASTTNGRPSESVQERKAAAKVASRNSQSEEENRPKSSWLSKSLTGVPKKKIMKRRLATATAKKAANVQCPLCQKMFVADVVENHAADCSGQQSLPDDTDVLTTRTPKNLNRCYICRYVYQVKDYADHVKRCIANREAENKHKKIQALSLTPTNTKSSFGSKTTENTPLLGKSLLGLLAENDVKDSTGNTVLNMVLGNSPKKHVSLSRRYNHKPSETTASDVGNISLNHVSMSPYCAFVPISKQPNSLIDYKNQFTYKATTTRKVYLKSGAQKKKKKRKQSKRKRSN